MFEKKKHTILVELNILETGTKIIPSVSIPASDMSNVTKAIRHVNETIESAGHVTFEVKIDQNAATRYQLVPIAE